MNFSTEGDENCICAYISLYCIYVYTREHIYRLVFVLYTALLSLDLFVISAYMCLCVHIVLSAMAAIFIACCCAAVAYYNNFSLAVFFLPYTRILH